MSLVEKLEELKVIPDFVIAGIFENKGRQYTILECYDRADKISFCIKYLDGKDPIRGFVSLPQLLKHKYIGKYHPLRLIK